MVRINETYSRLFWVGMGIRREVVPRVPLSILTRPNGTNSNEATTPLRKQIAAQVGQLVVGESPAQVVTHELALGLSR